MSYSEYKKLTGKGRYGIFHRRNYLYLGKDHILNVNSNGFSERYKRFYFKDIQAIKVQKSNRGKIWNVVLGSLFGLFFLISLIASESLKYYFGFIASPFLIVLFLNLWRGATCKCKLYTAVNTHDLGSLCRLKEAQKAIDRINWVIRQYQKDLEVPDIDSLKDISYETKNNIVQSETAENVNYFNENNLANTEYSGKYHEIAFIFLLLATLCGFLQTIVPAVVWNYLAAIFGMTFTVFIIISLKNQYNSLLPKSLKVISWISSGYVMLSGFIFYIVFLVYYSIQMQSQNPTFSGFNIYQELMKTTPKETESLKWFFLINALVGFLFSSFGILLSTKSKKNVTKLKDKSLAESIPSELK